MKYLPIFAYGSLRTGYVNHKMIDLKYKPEVSDAILLDSATMYTFPKDDFPFIVLDNSHNDIVGELFYIQETQYLQTMKELDRLEHYSQNSENNVFNRIECKVLDINTGEEIAAWIYVASDRMAPFCENEAIQIESGDWEDYKTAQLDNFPNLQVSLDDDLNPWLNLNDYDLHEDAAFLAYNNSNPAPMPVVSRPRYNQVQPATKTTSSTTVSTFYCPKAKEKDIFVWYIAYGSNLNEDRFLKYLNAGRYGNKEKFVPGEIESVQVQIPHGVYFAKSGRWGSGGIAFLDVDALEDFTCAVRAYKLTIQQFWSVVCQENGNRKVTLDWKKLESDHEYSTPEKGLYSRIINLGTIEGIPAFTVTNPESYKSQLEKEKTPIPWQYLELGMLNPPSREYLNTINEGTEQTGMLPERDLYFFQKKKENTPVKKSETGANMSNIKVTSSAKKVTA